MTDTTSDLVQQGLTAARVGDLSEARRLLTRATQQNPGDVQAWLSLAGVVDSLDYKQKCFTKVLELDPDNTEAQSGLALLEAKRNSQEERIAAAESIHPAIKIDAGPEVCYRHPDVETSLRCNKCGKPICPKCAVRTPVGFRCPECIREQENKYYSGTNLDYILGAVIAFPLSLVTAGLFTTILSGFGFFTLIIGFFVAPAVAGFIAEAVRWGVKKRRSRYLRHVVVGCLLAATAPFLIFGLLAAGIWGALMPGMFMFLGAATISARLR
jgi:hypothetical protein